MSETLTEDWVSDVAKTYQTTEYSSRCLDCKTDKPLPNMKHKGLGTR